MRWLPVVVLVLTSCSSETRSLPAPATFDSAVVDVGGSKDASVPDARLPDVGDDVLLADASDVMFDGDSMSDCVVGKTCVGSEMPTWKLEDFQPKSTGFKKIYGLEGFKGKVTVVALLSGW